MDIATVWNIGNGKIVNRKRVIRKREMKEKDGTKRRKGINEGRQNIRRKSNRRMNIGEEN